MQIFNSCFGGDTKGLSMRTKNILKASPRHPKIYHSFLVLDNKICYNNKLYRSAHERPKFEYKGFVGERIILAPFFILWGMMRWRQMNYLWDSVRLFKKVSYKVTSWVKWIALKDSRRLSLDVL